MKTIKDIENITGIKDLGEYKESGKWLTWEQRGSKGLMEDRIAKLKESGIPAFFKAGDRTWGVLAEEIDRA